MEQKTMRHPITEESAVHKAWYDEARTQTPETVGAFIEKLHSAYEHDYGTICHAIAAAALGAARAIDKSEQGGITGFQAGAVMWEFIQHWMHLEGKPLRLVEYENLLFPQYEHKFTGISSDTASWLKEEAAKRLHVRSDIQIHPEVLAHWERLAAGEIPFGLKIDEAA